MFIYLSMPKFGNNIFLYFYKSRKEEAHLMFSKFTFFPIVVRFNIMSFIFPSLCCSSFI